MSPIETLIAVLLILVIIVIAMAIVKSFLRP